MNNKDQGTDEALRSLERIARLMDDCIRIPGTNLRFGLDPIIGLVPGAGDSVTAIVGLYTLFLAARAGAPLPLLAQMLINLLIDFAVGSVPIVGDLFDAGFKAHRRNLRLLRMHLAAASSRH